MSVGRKQDAWSSGIGDTVVVDSSVAKVNNPSGTIQIKSSMSSCSAAASTGSNSSIRGVILSVPRARRRQNRICLAVAVAPRKWKRRASTSRNVQFIIRDQDNFPYVDQSWPLFFAEFPRPCSTKLSLVTRSRVWKQRSMLPNRRTAFDGVRCLWNCSGHRLLLDLFVTLACRVAPLTTGACGIETFSWHALKNRKGSLVLRLSSWSLGSVFLFKTIMIFARQVHYCSIFQM